jgi:hypothetical protein
MHWYNYLAIFFGGAFLANCIPHLVNGLSGRSFQSPFASPPGKGLSSSTVNVLWGMFNLLVAYFLTIRFGQFNIHDAVHATTLGAGMLLISIPTARHFGQFHGGR